MSLFLVLSSIVFGAVFGSFAAVLGSRMAEALDFHSKSRCEKCLQNLSWWEMIPILSFLLLRGKCRNCNKSIPAEVFLAELFGICCFLILFSDGWKGFGYGVGVFITTISLVGIFVADIQYHLIPDKLLALFFVGVLLMLYPLDSTIIVSRLLMTMVIFCIFFGLWWITNERGIGFGDVKLAGLLAFWLGKEKIWVGLYVAFLTAALIGIYQIIFQKAGLKSRLAFGPFLIIGAVFSYKYWGIVVQFWTNQYLFFR